MVMIFAGCSKGCAQSQALMTAAIDGVMIYWLAVSGPIPHPSDSGNERKPFVSDSHLVMRSVNLAEAKAGLSALLDAVAAGEEEVITRRGRSVARLIRESDSEAASGDWVARLRRFHAHQPGPAGSAVELLRELRDQEP